MILWRSLVCALAAVALAAAFTAGCAIAAAYEVTALSETDLPSTLYGHDYATGAAVAPFSGAPVTISGTVFEVTNANDSGPGSLRQALADASKSGRPAIIRIKVSGVLKPESTLFLPSVPFTIDARGQDFRIVVSELSFNLLQHAAATNGVLLNLYLDGGRQQKTSDLINIWGENRRGGANYFFGHLTLLGNVDGRLDITASNADGFSWTAAYVWTEGHGGASPGNKFGLQGDGGSSRAATGMHDGALRATYHHNRIEARQRGPLMHGYVDSYNNIRRWSLAGVAVRNGTAQLWSENDTFDAKLAPSAPINRRGDGILVEPPVGPGGTPALTHKGARTLNGATLIEPQGEVVDPNTLYARHPCPASAEHDAWVESASGAIAQVTLGGTVIGAHESLVGKTVTLTLPLTRAWPAGSAFDNARQKIIAGFNMPLFRNVTSIERTSDQVVTATIDADPADGGELYWHSDVLGSWLISWNPLTIKK